MFARGRHEHQQSGILSQEIFDSFLSGDPIIRRAGVIIKFYYRADPHELRNVVHPSSRGRKFIKTGNKHSVHGGKTLLESVGNHLVPPTSINLLEDPGHIDEVFSEPFFILFVNGENIPELYFSSTPAASTSAYNATGYTPFSFSIFTTLRIFSNVPLDIHRCFPRKRKYWSVSPTLSIAWCISTDCVGPERVSFGGTEAREYEPRVFQG